MQSAIWDFLSTEGFQPHGYCLLWQPEVFWLHVVSDAVIVLSYLSIPVALVYLAMKRRDFAFGWLLLLFGAFIVGCAITHALGIWTMWVPSYGVEGLAKAATAAVSLATAVALWPLMPTLVSLPSPAQLAEKNAALASEVAERKSAETALNRLNAELEARVRARTEELERANAALEAARREADASNALKSEFLATMSHELRTPMNGVMGMLDLLMRGRLDDDQRRLAGVAKQAADGLLVILNDILDYSKLEAGSVTLAREPFSPAETVRGVVELMRPRAEAAGLLLSLEIAPDLPERLSGDAQRLGQVLFNLVGNAVKFTETGGVAVTVAHRTLEDGGEELSFAVRDTGPGIPEAAQARLFRRFSQVDGSHGRRCGGTGLGLAISRQLTELMGGRIGLRSAPGEGSVFWFTVHCAPVAAEPAPQAAERAGERGGERAGEREGGGAATGAPLALLVAEDNPINQLYVQRVLELAGHAVTLVGNGRDAVAAAASGRFDAILMDVSMPEMDGPAATRAIRALGGAAARAPVIAMTAHAMAGDREALLSQGMDDYVSKPLEPAALEAALRRAVAARRAGGQRKAV